MYTRLHSLQDLHKNDEKLQNNIFYSTFFLIKGKKIILGPRENSNASFTTMIFYSAKKSTIE